MGSPLFAVPTLKSIIDNKNFELIAIYTQAPKPQGRGLNIQKTLVHCLAEEHNLLVKHPATLRKSEVIEEIISLKPDVIVVVAYGLILPQDVLNIPKYGCINLHPSALPLYRGAAPLQRTILGGETSSSICIIKMDKGVDSGDILIQKDFALANNITFNQLHDYTSNTGADLMVEVLNNINNITPVTQNHESATYANKILKSEAQLNFSTDDITLIDRKIRALNPIPGTYFIYKGEQIKIKEANISDQPHNYTSGTIIDKDFSIACKGGILRPIILQRPGKKPVSIQDFVKGFEFEIGMIAD
jgi:methionyl-tRNA formyltransferase